MSEINKTDEEIKFNLTSSMSLELIKFNNLKKEINKLKDIKNKNKQVLDKIAVLNQELNECKEAFIREFRLNNKEEITEYLKDKD